MEFYCKRVNIKQGASLISLVPITALIKKEDSHPMMSKQSTETYCLSLA